MKKLIAIVSVLSVFAVSGSANAAPYTADQVEQYLTSYPSVCESLGDTGKTRQCLAGLFQPARDHSTASGVKDSELTEIARNHVNGRYRNWFNDMRTMRVPASRW